jgi:TatD DNase family protein
MAIDAHIHPFDLEKVFPHMEAERQKLGIHCASSSWNEEQFLYHEQLSQTSKQNDGAVMLLCFGVHPQLPFVMKDISLTNRLCTFLHELAEQKRLDAVGETGFDYFDKAYRATKDIQQELFLAHLYVAKEYKLPMVLHIRKAMDQVFYYAKELAALPSVIFHSYSGTLREAEDILKRKVNAYFSFGTAIALNHKRAMEAVSFLPQERLLTETDAPYQPLRNNRFSSWKDIHTVLQTMADLRRQSGTTCQNVGEIESHIDENFRKAFFVDEKEKR